MTIPKAKPLHPEARIWLWATPVLFVLGLVCWMWSTDWRVAVTGVALSTLTLFTAALINHVRSS